MYKKSNLNELRKLVNKLVREEVGGVYNSWVMPSDEVLKREFHVEQVLKGNEFWEDEYDFMEAVSRATVEEITPSKDRQIGYRSRTETYDNLLSLIKSYRSYPQFRNEGTLKNLYKRLQENEPLDYPIVVEFSDGARRVFSGNTRMDVAFQLGINPKVLVVKSTLE